MEPVRDHQARINAPSLDHRGEALRAESPAGHQPAADLLVRHAAAPFRARNVHKIALAEIVDRGDDPARLDHADGRVERVRAAARDADLVHAASLRLRQDLLGQIAVAVAEKVICAVGRGDLAALGPRANGIDVRRAAQPAARNRHQSDRPDADDGHVLAELHLGQLRRVQPRRHHIAEHRRRARLHVLRQAGQVCVRLVDVEKFGEHAVLEV